mmetsp:Transcript_16061/g.26944  ORF Transcript_16061/g.26944 Transcript_16061/m.26944 type:complete len:446 (+) Transcript_16061:744-2081(+)
MRLSDVVILLCYVDACGRPFVAVVFAPLGVHMVASCFVDSTGEVLEGEVEKGGCVYRSSWHALLLLLAGGAGILLLTVLCVLAVDSALYGQLTFPPLNIALYNALHGSGDELYGVEPTSYYLKNLLLMVGLVAAPIAAASPAALMARLLLLGGRGAHIEGKVLTICVAMYVWVLLLMSRPHKEERFMYPVYPLMCSLAAMALETGARILERACALRNAATSTLSSRKDLAQVTSCGVLPRVLAVLVCGLAATLGASRVFASYRNYGGYFKLWAEVHSIMTRDSHGSGTAQLPPTVCMGGEWYTFPSHFFLPTGAQLAFVQDGFGGLLPQPYVETSAAPPQPMNDRNEEEPLRYVPLGSCDYFVLSVPAAEDEACDGTGSPILAHVRTPRASRLHCEPLIDAKRSTSALSRAFAIPHYSAGHNHFIDYCVFKNMDRQPDRRAGPAI